MARAQGHHGDELANLLAQAGRGDQSAFADLYDRVIGVVHGTVLKIVRDPAQTEEIVQEVFVELWRLAPRYERAKGSVGSWVATLAHRRAVDRVRSEQSARNRAERDASGVVRDHDSVADTVAQSVDSELDRVRVRRSLGRLTELQRESVELAYFGGYTYGEVAVLLDVPEGTVKTRIRDGLIRLRDELGGVGMSGVDLHHLAAAYALDALDEDERAQFEAHYSTCDVCRTDVADHRETAASLAALVETPAPAHVKDAVMARIGETRQLSPIPGTAERLADRRRPRRAVNAVVAMAAAVALFVAGAVLIGSRGGDGFGDEVAAVLADPDARFARLTSTGAGTVSVAWTDRRAVVIGEGLPEPGLDLVYELWVIDAEGAHPTGLLDRAREGRVRRVVDLAFEPDVWGITIEPAAGSETPTEPIVFVAEV